MHRAEKQPIVFEYDRSEEIYGTVGTVADCTAQWVLSCTVTLDICLNGCNKMAPLPSLVTETHLVLRSPLSPVILSEDAPCLACSSTFDNVEAIPDDLLGHVTAYVPGQCRGSSYGHRRITICTRWCVQLICIQFWPAVLFSYTNYFILSAVSLQRPSVISVRLSTHIFPPNSTLAVHM